jgi:hypothetical protein
MEMLGVVGAPGHPGERSKGGDEVLEDAPRCIAERHLHEHHVLLEVPNRRAVKATTSFSVSESGTKRAGPGQYDYRVATDRSG